MTLEDFFTLTEMKDGLTASSRVEELIAVMKREKDSVLKNVSEGTRQWAAVASTIAATDDKDCINLFINLDGLSFIDQWLSAARELGNDASDSFVEESITSLLRALEKLQINNERSVSSGICITVKNLLSHKSALVQEKVQVLLDSWNLGKVDEDVSGEVKNNGVLGYNGSKDHATCNEETSRLDCSTVNASLSKGSSDEGIDGGDTAIARDLPSGGRDDLQPEKTKSLQSENSNNELPSQISSDHITREDRSSSALPSSSISKAALENSSTNENVPTCSNAVSKHENNEASGIEKLNEVSSGKNRKLDAAASTSSTREHLVSSGTDVGSAEEIFTEAKLQNSADACKNDCTETAALSDSRMPVSELKSSVDDIADHSAFAVQIKGQDGESHSNKLQGSPGNNLMSEKPQHLDTSVSRMVGTGTADEDGEHSSDGLEILRRCSEISKRASSPDINDKRKSDIRLEYGLVDALEVARKVALEAEREVVGGKEPSCSSPEKVSGGGIVKESASDDRVKEVSTGPDHSVETDNGEARSANSNIMGTETENEMRDADSSQVTVAQEPEPDFEKSLCHFDLNQEVRSDDMEHAATPGLSAAPLHFDGTFGQKGSPATSDFHPTSPRRNSDCDKMLSIGGTSSSSKPRPDCFVFDLNVAESGDDEPTALMLGKQITASSGLLSAESSQEASTRRSEMFNLDLNHTSEDGDAPPSDLRVEKQFFHNRNVRRSPSPASSSSSKQSSLRNIDLNDRPVLQIDKEPYFGRSTLNLHAFGGPKLDDPAISIMGTRVEVDTKDFMSHASSIPNGKALDIPVDANVASPGFSFGLGPPTPFAHSSVYGYNGFTPPPTMYGPGGSISYMVNTRGAPVMPQIMGSAIPSYSQPQFIMSMNGASLSLNGAVRPRSNFDLNSGFSMEGGNRDPIGLRQPFMPDQSSRSFEDFLGVNSRPSSSGVVGEKRKEPEGGLESFPSAYKQQFPWK